MQLTNLLISVYLRYLLCRTELGNESSEVDSVQVLNTGFLCSTRFAPFTLILACLLHRQILVAIRVSVCIKECLQACIAQTVVD